MHAFFFEDLIAEDGRDPGLVFVLLVVVRELDNLGRRSCYIAGSPNMVVGVTLFTEMVAEITFTAIMIIYIRVF